MLVWRQGVRVVQIGNCTRDCKSVAGTRGSCDRKPEALTRNCPAVTQGQQSTSTVAIGAQFSFLCVYPRLFRVVGVISLHSTTIHANPVFVSCDHTTIRRRRGQRPAQPGSRAGKVQEETTNLLSATLATPHLNATNSRHTPSTIVPESGYDLQSVTFVKIVAVTVTVAESSWPRIGIVLSLSSPAQGLDFCKESHHNSTCRSPQPLHGRIENVRTARDTSTGPKCILFWQSLTESLLRFMVRERKRASWSNMQFCGRDRDSHPLNLDHFRAVLLQLGPFSGHQLGASGMRKISNAIRAMRKEAHRGKRYPTSLLFCPYSLWARDLHHRTRSA